MKKYILITLISLMFISACSDVKEDTSQNVIPSTLIQPASKTIILQEANQYSDNLAITYPKPEKVNIVVTTNNPNILLNGKSSITLFFDESNYLDPQEIHFSTSLKSVTNVCLGQEFQVKYEITSTVTGETITQVGNGYIVDKNHSTNFYLNKSGNAPLTVTANIITNEPTTLEYSLLNKEGTGISLTKIYNDAANEHNMQIYGLYENHTNIIEVKGKKADGSLCFTQKVPVKTEQIDFPNRNPDGTIGTVHNLSPDKVDNSWILLQLLNSNENHNVIVDLKGNIRWVLKHDGFAAPIRFMKDDSGNGDDVIEFLELDGDNITYFDMAGKTLDKTISGLSKAHHDSVNIPNTNKLLILANHPDYINRATFDDVVVEYDTNTKSITNYYDTGKLLPIDRRVNIVTFIERNTKDWFHSNSIDYDATDNGIIVSGRHQGVIKFNRDFTDVKWILAPHDRWSGSNVEGMPVDVSKKVLTPVDMYGNKITDNLVLTGWKADASGFDWTWGQHNAKILKKEGNILTLIVFDNGDNRHRKGEQAIGTYDDKGYSRAVIYEIDEASMTIKQIWEAGKSLGANGYSQIMSNAEMLSNGNIQMFSSFVIESSKIRPHSSYFEYEYNNPAAPIYQIIFPQTFRSYRAYRINPFDVLNKE